MGLLGLGVLIIITFVLCLYLLKPKKMRVYIPKDIYICYKTVEDLPPEVVNRWKRLNPEYKVHVYGDAECRSFIEETYGKAYADFFASIPSGPIKADFWRVCILYAKGGVYADADIEPLVPIGDFLEEGIELCTCSTYKGNPNLSINPHQSLTILSSKNALISCLKNESYRLIIGLTQSLESCIRF